MLIDLIGHATLAVQTRDRHLLFDPVFGDAHQHGLCAVFPPRRVLEERLPRFDTLVVTHQHLDHFDLATLSRLPRDVDVLLPEDRALVDLLKGLGFERLHALRPWSRVELGATSLLAIPSDAPLPELGFLVWDEDACCWNAVDTVLTQDAVAVARSQAPPIDVLFASFQPLLEGRLASGRDFAFPFDEYGRLLQRVHEIAPAHVVPASAGFCYQGSAAWQNQCAFPVTRERFAEDVVSGQPALRGRVSSMDPGDRLRVFAGRALLEERGCAWVERDDADPALLDFAPVLAPAPLHDDPPTWAKGVDLAAVAEGILSDELPALLAARPDLLASFARWGLVYQLVVVTPTGHLRWVYDFTAGALRVSRDRDPCANAFAWVTASGLYGLRDARLDWSALVLGGAYRGFDRLYRATPAGLARPEGVVIPNLLQLRFPVRAAFRAAQERAAHSTCK